MPTLHLVTCVYFTCSSKTDSSHKSKGKKKGRLISWTVKMVCLAGTSDCRTPTTAAGRQTLIEAGLGEKKVIIPDINMEKEEFWSTIMGYFPKLKDCGGFELLRCVANSRDLEVISPNISRSPSLIRAMVGNSRVFIRPIQQDLDITPILTESSPPEVCVCFD